MTKFPSKTHLTNKVKTPNFNKLLGQVRNLILSARRMANRSVDTIQILTNFRIVQVIWPDGVWLIGET